MFTYICMVCYAIQIRRKSLLLHNPHQELNTGQTEQFERHMARSYQKMYRLAFRLTYNRADAEDLTQEAFCKAFRSYGDYETDKSFENWVSRILTRLFLDMLRKRGRTVSTVSFDAPLSVPLGNEAPKFDAPDTRENPVEMLMSSVLSEDLGNSLAKISESQRMLLFLADIMEMPYKEIASFLGVPTGTVRSRLHRTHRQLRSYLE